MNKIFLFLLLFPFAGFAQITPAQPVAVEKSFVITGKIKGLKAGQVVKLVHANSSAQIASGVVVEKKTSKKVNGKLVTTKTQSFVLKGRVAEPDLHMLAVGDLPPFHMYVENTPITVEGSSTEVNKWKVKGSASQNDFAEFEKIFTPIAQNLNSIAASINQLAIGPARDAMMTNFTNAQQKFQTEIDSFVNRKSKSFVTPFVLLVTMGYNDDINLAEGRFNRLDTIIKSSSLGQSLAAMIAEKKIGAVGTQALEFTQADTSGTPVSLSSFRGKYVLVDFWASWCGPCRNENPNVVSNYQKFREKNFTVLGVSLERPGQKDKWMEAIKEDNLTWTHVSDLQHWNNEAARLYHISGIPQNILIDPTGKIVGRNLRGPALEEKLCEVLGCN